MRHLESGEVAAYLDNALAPSDRSRIEGHAAECEVCRAELIETASLLRTRPRLRRRYLPAGVAAAVAAAAMLVLWPRSFSGPAGSSGYREPVVTTSIAPAVVAPRGAATAARVLVWTAVPRADRYRVTLFDETGSVAWETQTTDTAAPLPDSVRLRTGTSYLWKVEAQTGWNRWVASDLVEFSLRSPRP